MSCFLLQEHARFHRQVDTYPKRAFVRPISRTVSILLFPVPARKCCRHHTQIINLTWREYENSSPNFSLRERSNYTHFPKVFEDSRENFPSVSVSMLIAFHVLMEDRLRTVCQYSCLRTWRWQDESDRERRSWYLAQLVSLKPISTKANYSISVLANLRLAILDRQNYSIGLASPCDINSCWWCLLQWTNGTYFPVHAYKVNIWHN